MTSEEHSSATEAMARLVAQRERARARVDELEAEQREASAAAQQASAELVELERKGSRPGAQRSKLEAQLAEAKAKATQPWAERIAGARSRVGDCHADVAPSG
jgi:chromosome segregation ATPase